MKRMLKMLLATGLLYLPFTGSILRAEDLIHVPLPLTEQIKSGQIKIEATSFDIGTPEMIFDGDPHTLARTPAVNPAFVRIEFPEPITVQHFRLYFSGDEHQCTLAAADCLKELAEKTGSYRRIAENLKVPRTGEQTVTLPAPVTAKAFQLDVKRLTGDDYVHIHEWQFCRPVPLKTLRVQYLAARELAHKPAEIRDLPEKLARPVSSLLVLKVRAEGADGARVDVSDAVTWKAEPESALVPFGETPGQFYLKTAGAHRLTASYGAAQQTVLIEALPREMKNRQDDLEVAYIERLPRGDYDGPNGGWPAPGSIILWRGHVYNWGLKPVVVKYEWLLDDEVIQQGKREIPPMSFDTAAGPLPLSEKKDGAKETTPPFLPARHAHAHEDAETHSTSETAALEELYRRYSNTAFDLRWRWEQKRHKLALRITPVEPLNELIPSNNELAIITDALGVGFWVEESLWLHHHEHQHELPAKDANSFAGWAQRAMRAWNEMFAAAVFPETPQGILDRVRIDRLVIVPDGALPLAGGLPSNNPDNRDKTVDLLWGFPTKDLESNWWSPEKAKKLLADKKKEGAAFYIDFALFHELGHARYLVDTYGFDVHAGPDDLSKPRNVRVTDEKGPVLGRYMPERGLLHKAKYAGQMSSDYTRYSAYEALMLNRVAGKRARGGNANSPSVIGEYLQEIPAKVVYAVTDADGRPLADAEVWAYQAKPDPQAWYGKVYIDPPDVQTRTDAQGRATFDRTLFAKDGKIVHTFGHANSVVLLRVTFAGRHYYWFEEVSDCNMAYALGQGEEAVFQRRVRLRQGEPSPAEWRSE